MIPRHEDVVLALAVASDGEVAISGDALGQRIIWRRDGAPFELAPPSFPSRRAVSFGGPPEEVFWVGLSDDGRIAASAHQGGVVAVFDPRTGRPGPVLPLDLGDDPQGPWTRLEVPELEPPLSVCGNGPRYLVPPAFSPDGRRLLTVGDAGDEVAIRLWNPRRGEALATWTVDERVYAVGFSARGEPLLHAGTELVVLSDPPRFVAHEVRSAQLRDDGTVVLQLPGGVVPFDPSTGVAGPIVDRRAPDPPPEPQVQVVDGRVVFPER